MEQTNIDMEDMEEMEHEEMEIQQPEFGQEKSNKEQEKKAPEQAVSPMKKVNVLLEEQSNMSVSYTHLDVYKRQGYGRPGC